MRKNTIVASTAAMLACFLTAMPETAHGAPNVFDDAVFWFRGGKDRNGDRYMRQQGEFFDDLHADDTTHANHQSEVQTYTSSSLADGFKANAVFQTERVVFPALGTAKNMPVLHLSNNAIQYNEKVYYWPQYVKPYNIFANNNISSEYTVISRLRLDEDGMKQTQCLLRIGYNGSAKKGLMLGFAPCAPGYTNKYITAFCTPNESGSNTQVNFDTIGIPTNTWVDVAVVVGDNHLRIGVAFPQTSAFHGNNHTIAFAQTNMWTDNCTLLSKDYYRFFSETGQTSQQLANGADKTCFTGSVQQMAIWGRALSDQEVMEAFGMPRPAIFRTGFDNGASNEFGGTRSSASQTIDGLGSWQNIANTMQAGDTWTVNFNALRDEANLPQIFSIKSLRGSAAQIEPKLNGTSLGEGRVASNQRFFWPVAANLVREGANELVIERKDGCATDFKVDAMELGGALGVGSASDTYDDGRVFPELIATGVPSAADPNLAHWPVGFRPFLNNNTNLHFRVWVDPDVVGVCTSRFWTRVQCKKRTSSSAVTGQEKFTIFVNGEAKTTFNANGSWKDVDPITFDPGVLRGGWNDFEIRSNEAYTTLYWVFDRYRFETVLPSPFGFPMPPGLSVFIR